MDKNNRFLSQKNLSTRQNGRLKLTLKEHSIDLKKQCIKINKNLIDFSKVSTYIKYFFIQAYKQCIRANCLYEIFEQLSNKRSSDIPAISIQIKDNDALAIIMRIMRLIHQKNVSSKLQILKSMLQSCNNKLKQCLDFRQQINKKHQSIYQIIHQKILKTTKEQSQLHVKFKLHLEEINCKIQKLLEQRQKIKAKFMFYNDLTHMKMPSNQLSICLNKTISKLARNLIKESILMIVQNEQELNPEQNNQSVYVIFQQSYPTIKIKKKNIIRLINFHSYLQNIKKCQDVRKACSNDKFNALMCCHTCMNIYDPSKLYFCDKKIGKKLTSGYDSSDYYIYRNNYLKSDYFRRNQSHVLSFFAYNEGHNKKLICNRGFCAECLQKVYKIDPLNCFCPYCEGMCACHRCAMGVGLVKLIAHDLEYDPTQSRNYHNILDLLRPHKSKYVQDSLQLRKPSESLQYSIICQNNKQTEPTASVKKEENNRIDQLSNEINQFEQMQESSNADPAQKNLKHQSIHCKIQNQVMHHEFWSQYVNLN